MSFATRSMIVSSSSFRGSFNTMGRRGRSVAVYHRYPYRDVLRASQSVMVIPNRQYNQEPTAHHSNPGQEGRFIRIVEVSARDGLQNLPAPIIPTQTKLDLINKLLDTGLRNIEVGSFVRGDWVPQMADSARLLRQLRPLSSIPPPSPSSSPLSSESRSGLGGIPKSSGIQVPAEDVKTHYPVLVPNSRGLDNLLRLEEEHRSQGGKERLTDEISVFVAATEAFSQANNNAPIDKVLNGLSDVMSRAQSHGYRVRGYVSCVMTCPYSGPTAPSDVIKVSTRLLDMGCYEISLGDTTGEGNPTQWTTLWHQLKRAGIDMNKIAAHCHDTFSMSLPSLMALLPLGLRTIDSSLAGLGGCPYSPGATGNVPTEDVVYMLHKMGYETGVDLEKLVEAGDWLSRTLGVRNESRAGRAIWARKQAREAKERKAAEGEDSRARL